MFKLNILSKPNSIFKVKLRYVQLDTTTEVKHRTVRASQTGYSFTVNVVKHLTQDKNLNKIKQAYCCPPITKITTAR